MYGKQLRLTGTDYIVDFRQNLEGQGKTPQYDIFQDITTLTASNPFTCSPTTTPCYDLKISESLFKYFNIYF